MSPYSKRGLINDLYIIKREELGKVEFSFRNRLILLVTLVSISYVLKNLLFYPAIDQGVCE